MCGIAGLWAPRIEADQRTELVAAMLERLRHRGPNGRALWGDDQVTLGLMRLAIVSPDSPASVASDENGRVHAVMNGEIYNHVALRNTLAARHHRIGPGPDSLVLPHLYQDESATFPTRLDGQYAIGLWDAGERRLVLARDRAGEKPLFYYESPEGFAFASEPGALATLPWYRFAPNPDALSRYLVHGFFAGDDCAFEGIRQMRPASVLEATEKGARASRYWRPWDGIDRPSRDENPGATTRETLAAAVRSRIPTDVPFGVLLSGGVDSGLITVLAAREAGKRFPTFSLRFDERGYDEAPFARQVARSVDTDHHVVTLDAGEADTLLDDVADALQQPLGDPSALPTWTIARHAAKHVPVVLSGEAGDELFAGYPTYLGHRYAARAQRIPAGIRDAIRRISGRLRPKHHHLTIPYFIERFLEGAAMPAFDRHVAWFGTSAPALAPGLLAPDIAAALSDDAARWHVDRLAATLTAAPVGDLARDPDLLAYQLLDFELYLGGLLTKVDRCTMDHGMEARAPFLEPSLIRFALSLPERDRLRGKTGKWALREAARGLLPESVLTRRKQGFSPPFSAWMRGPLRESILRRLSRERIAKTGVLNATTVPAMLEAHMRGEVERGRTVWALLSLQMWAERWSGATVAIPTAAERPATAVPIAP